MVVEITNLTDAPGRNPKQFDIYNRILNPGESLRLPADLVDRRLRELEKTGDIAIGQVPPWYSTAKLRKGRTLTQEEIAKRQSPPRPPVAETPPPPKKPEKLELADEAPLPTDEFTRNRKRRGE